ncbi:MAG: acetyl-CoA acetyltransferase, acetyl-CoA C-acetyltransferase [Microgenomates group bacterium GW2011_GWC1_41_8]|uniref:Acetyl-CoA acyltransferase n=3 Tax=Candidatus Roizmaniibacteriota TaxID=1752723 RepID=A0A0G1AC06_9BACT|nr:MAG: Acetyl-CoA acyltransferase [Candidatus Levybacteria bacterium GW2011_GWA2_40_16]KKR72331.1 MAG: Acetyl-CoA acyltransferase [Candidatus Roizmanbacteria bacterium GW2011_GWB1_40_7]KKR93189.1 MAG: Acetyl-CoA acyltransferase [Candidatus Roizmanbacteria bacterium GW2011_GWA1_41_13]KKS22818.1 MAG: Acetyl-CoA acyltransferase [Candidatus Roizmanbacteria bacterium GW2011_GWC2_41_7]KKS23105.1 MAG: acetyl-CoA acetyltransferase, acetyl-CoA C-acetyltransferase [Microgenomates group bacterium GW2011_
MNINVLGVGTTKFGELWDVSPRTLIREAYENALTESGLDPNTLDGIFVGNMLSGILGNQENMGAFVSESIGLTGKAAVKVEGACASGGLAVHQGVLSILSGQYQAVLVVGIEKMTDHKPEEVAGALMGAGSDEERSAGLTFPGLYSLMARVHMQQYKTTEEDMAAVSVKNHYHASFNSKAQFRKEISIEDVLKSPCISDPLKLLDCSPISDGASAIILSRSGLTRKSHDTSVSIIASSASSDSLGLCGRSSLTSLSATKTAAGLAYQQAKLQPKDIDIAEVHDCFSIAEIMALEDLGFYEKGRAGSAIGSGDVTLGSSKKLVVNTSGGLKACGHPVGATGVKQVVEVVEQLRGTVGKRQLKNARIGLTHNVGGSGAVAAVHILENNQ